MNGESKILTENIVSRINTVLQKEFLALTEVENDKIYVKFIDGQKFRITVIADVEAI